MIIWKLKLCNQFQNFPGKTKDNLKIWISSHILCFDSKYINTTDKSNYSVSQRYRQNHRIQFTNKKGKKNKNENGI